MTKTASAATNQFGRTMLELLTQGEYVEHSSPETRQASRLQKPAEPSLTSGIDCGELGTLMKRKSFILVWWLVVASSAAFGQDKLYPVRGARDTSAVFTTD